jgi:hypothetical protein
VTEIEAAELDADWYLSHCGGFGYMRKMILLFLPVIPLFALSGCGGGGGNTAGPATAVVKLSAYSTDVAQTIGDITVTLDLPAGVSVEVKPDGSGQTADGVVVASGSASAPNSIAIAKYNGASGTVEIQVVKSDGFNLGEFVTVVCNLSAGVTPVLGDFNTSNFSAFDLTGNTITNVTVGRTLKLQ